MKKHWITALLAMVLAAALLPAPAHAAQAAGRAGSSLTGANRAVYEALKDEIVRIASGARTSTAIPIPDQPALSWSLEEVGISGSPNENVLEKLEAKLGEALDFERVYVCLSLDYPFEMFWKSNQFALGYSFTRGGGRASTVDLTVHLQVSQDYRGGSDMNVDPDRVAAAGKAAENAKAIVEKYQGLSNYEKLAGYCREICQLVSYDMQSLLDGAPYGDPWQMVSVFDGDPNTNVVCEGYSKAFQYLCDLSDFDGDVVCWTASGAMGGANHMWNVVRMEDGKNYLVDVTNCDERMIGEDGELFLSGAAGGGRSYIVSKGPCYASYTYSDMMEGMYGDGFLALSDSDYVYDPGAQPSPAPDAAPEPSPAPAFSDVEPTAYYADAVAWAVEQGITNGTTDTTFEPGKTCTEAEILTFLWRAEGRPDNSQGVTDGTVFYDAALHWAYDLGMPLPSGFDPSTPCTRSSAVSFIWWAFGKSAPDGESSFTDVAGDAPYAEAVAWAVEQGVTKGMSDTTFEPDTTCTRGQIVTYLYRAYHGA